MTVQLRFGGDHSADIGVRARPVLDNDRLLPFFTEMGKRIRTETSDTPSALNGITIRTVLVGNSATRR
jgi:hypothetical protein